MTRNRYVTWHKRSITQESCLTLEIPDGERRRYVENYSNAVRSVSCIHKQLFPLSILTVTAVEGNKQKLELRSLAETSWT